MHFKKSFLAILFLAIFTSFVGVDKKAIKDDIWKILLKVKYSFKGNKYTPKFEAKHKALDRKTVTISGYMYPLEEAKEHQYFMLSYYPIKVCFFCGGAGPESIIEVNTQKPVKFTSKKITLTGQLRLNPDDPDRMFFILLNAQQK